jgi:hypothetical protein
MLSSESVMLVAEFLRYRGRGKPLSGNSFFFPTPAGTEPKEKGGEVVM